MRMESANEFPTLFSPITVGTMKLRNRVMLPPHASAIGNIFGTEEDAARNIAYFERPELHVLGDAYAPRRLVFATRQAYALARQLVALKT